LIGGGNRFSWLKLVPATAALAAIVFAVVWSPGLLSDFKVKQAQKEVAAAFVERRTTPMRLTSVDYAPYSPFPVVLGAENGRGVDEVPTSLHDASGAANKNLHAAKPDPRGCKFKVARCCGSPRRAAWKKPRKISKKRGRLDWQLPAWKLTWLPATLNATAGPNILTCNARSTC